MAIVLRDYQVKAKKDIYRAWDEGHKNVLLTKPTGMGKTKTFVSLAIETAIDPRGPKFPTAIMVHRKELVQQISLTLAEEGVPHNIIAQKPTILGIIGGQRKLFKKQFYDINSPISVISVDTLNSRILKHETWAKSVRQWITDEAAHLLKNNKWGRSVSYFPNARGLGVTATPQRLDKKGLGAHVDGVFNTMVLGPSTRWGIEHGFLCNYKIAIPASDYEQHLKKASDGSDFSHEAMAEASAKSRIVGDAVANYIKFANGKQAIYFCTDIGAGKKMEEAFLEAGVLAKLLTSLSTDTERLESMIDYKEKRIQVLLNIDLFDEGLDVPGIEVVGMCRPTMSLSKFLQMIGRGLRPAEGKDYLIVLDHVGNVKRHGLPDSHRKWTLDRIIKRGDRRNLIRICSNVFCNAPFDRALTACPYCGKEVERSSNGEGGGRAPIEEVDGDLYLLDADTLRQMEESVRLESPESLARRVTKAAGVPAGIKAAKNQQARIETQGHLVYVIASWAGKMKKQGFTDRQIHKKFYIEYGKTITMALSEPRADMLDTMNNIQGDAW